MSATSSKSARKLAAKILHSDIPRESAKKNKKAAEDPKIEEVPAEMSETAPEESSDPSARFGSPVRDLEPGEFRFYNESELAAPSQNAIEGDADSRGPSVNSESTNNSPTSWEGGQFDESGRNENPTTSRMDLIEAQQSEILALVRQMAPRPPETLSTPSVRVSGMAMATGKLSSQRPYTILKKQGAIYGGSLAEDSPDSNVGDMVVGTTRINVNALLNEIPRHSAAMTADQWEEFNRKLTNGLSLNTSIKWWDFLTEYPLITIADALVATKVMLPLATVENPLWYKGFKWDTCWQAFRQAQGSKSGRSHDTSSAGLLHELRDYKLNFDGTRAYAEAYCNRVTNIVNTRYRQTLNAGTSEIS